MMPHVLVKVDRGRSQARRPFNQLSFIERGTAWDAGVGLQRTKRFAASIHNVRGTKDVQTKKLCVPREGGKSGGTLARQGNERNHVPDLTIESRADSIQEFRKRRADGDGSKNLFFGSQQESGAMLVH
jgi:hypothetical protein